MWDGIKGWLLLGQIVSGLPFRHFSFRQQTKTSASEMTIMLLVYFTSLLLQGWAKLVLIALERYSVALKRLTFNLR